MTTRLRFIKPWGPYKVGDIKVTESSATAFYLVERHKVAVVEPEPIAEPVPEQKFLRQAPVDKMVNSPVAAKSGKGRTWGRY